MGFFAPTPKRIAKELKSSCVKQQAQRVIRSAVMQRVDIQPAQRATVALVCDTPSSGVDPSRFSHGSRASPGARNTRGSLPKIAEVEPSPPDSIVETSADDNDASGNANIEEVASAVAEDTTPKIAEEGETTSNDNEDSNEQRCSPPRLESDIRHVIIPLGSDLNPVNPTSRLRSVTSDMNHLEDDNGSSMMNDPNHNQGPNGGQEMSPNDIMVTPPRTPIHNNFC